MQWRDADISSTEHANRLLLHHIGDNPGTWSPEPEGPPGLPAVQCAVCTAHGIIGGVRIAEQGRLLVFKLVFKLGERIGINRTLHKDPKNRDP
jgi:hypothetical protein